MAKRLTNAEREELVRHTVSMRMRLLLGKPMAWQPQFDAVSLKQEELALAFCAEIAGPRGKPGMPPDPVRLLETAAALYAAELEYAKEIGEAP